MTDKQTRIANRLQLLRDKHGKLTPDIVIADARNKSSPLHAEFEWRTDKAAMRYWRACARRIITSVEVVSTINRVRMVSVAYVRDPHAPTAEQGYIAVADIRSDRDLAQAAILQELDRLDAVLLRVRRLAEVLAVSPYVTVVANEVAALRERVGGDAAVAGS